MKATILCLPGDGIGPEVMAEATKVLHATTQRFDHRFTLEEAPIGGTAIDSHGSPLPDTTRQL
ncbi:MAG: 3-isopropylmalate dehydrogenase, partial [Dehalococcoidia bacterium]|nr:3-isopropylmalate dehydrogenase [Dehalococcoidia bacterium]